MADQIPDFVDGDTGIGNRVKSAWLNDVNDHVYRGTDISGIDVVNVKAPPYNAKGDGVTDDTAAIQAAFAIAGRFVFLPKGNYKITGNLTEPVCSGIIGEGENNSLITAAAGVTKALPLGTSCTVLRDFQVVGNSTASAIGILFGDSSSGAYSVENVLVQNFTGAGAVGAKLYQALKSAFTRLTISGCTDGLLVDGTGASGFPTTCRFMASVFRASTNVGVKVIHGNSISFDHECVYEANGKEGVKLIPGAGNTVADVNVEGWFEANWGGTSTEYQFVADGSGAAATCRFQLKDPSFHSSGAKSVKVTGAGCAGFIVDNPQVPNSSATILIANSCFGTCYNWAANLVYNTCVSDTARTGSTITFGMENIAGSWIAWTPTFASNIGNAAATFSGAVTVDVARAQLIGKHLTIQLSWSATLNAVTPSYISFTLPSSLVSQGASAFGTGTTTNNAVVELGRFLPFNDGTVHQFRMAAGNFTSGGAVGGSIIMDIETV